MPSKANGAKTKINGCPECRTRLIDLVKEAHGPKEAPMGSFLPQVQTRELGRRGYLHMPRPETTVCRRHALEMQRWIVLGLLEDAQASLN